MRKGLLVLLLGFGMLVLAPAIRPTAAAATPVHTLAASGTGVGMYPAFAAPTQRYGVTTTEATAGAVVVTASTSDPLGSVWVDGRLATGGTATVTGLTSGDEISVVIVDSAGSEVHSLVYLPPQFPAMSVVGSGTPEGGHVLLTLSRFTAGIPSFETAVDRWGVPAYVRSSLAGSLDLKPVANGHYTASREGALPGKTGSATVELDDQFRPVASYETASPLVNTDGHDSILRPNGNRILIAYEPNSKNPQTDAVIQEVDAQGTVLYTWNSEDHVDVSTDSVGGGPDYAHINSIEVMADGDILASFRHLSQVMKIAWTAHGRFARGDVVWRLGGRHSDFTFVDDDSSYLGGPCAQHTATQLPDGHILIFDNGSSTLGAPLCINPADRSGPAVTRPQTRVTEYALNLSASTATQVWSYQVPRWFALFAGSAQRLPNGDTLIGWAASKEAVATLVDPSRAALWTLADAATDPSKRFFTYRAAAASVADAVKPAVDVVRPQQDASYALGQVITSDFGCSDRGGSSLTSCQAGAARSGATLDTMLPGTHTFTVQATDGSGNLTSVTRTYRVDAADITPSLASSGAPPLVAARPLRRPDGLIRPRPDGRQVGGNVYGASAKQGVRQAVSVRTRSATAVVRFENHGNIADRITVHGTAGSPRFRVRYFAGGTDVTRQVTAGTYHTRSLLPGQASRLRVNVTRTVVAEAGDRRIFRLRGTSVGDTRRWDAVRTLVEATPSRHAG